jgi:hypothetical protein
MYTDNMEFCNSCMNCQTGKIPPSKPSGKAHPLPLPTKPWESISMDFLGPFPKVLVNGQNCNYLWVVICRLTSMVHLIPLHTKTTAVELSWIFVREIVRLHGLPRSIVSD